LQRDKSEQLGRAGVLRSGITYLSSMSPKRASFDVVRTIARDLPGVQESTMYGVPALKVRGKFLACMASHKSAEPGSLVVRTSFEARDALIADDPRTYYVKPHYQDYPSVLVRLSVIDREALRDLLHSAWRAAIASRTTRGAHTKTARKRGADPAR
jgi:hypothetical protein